MLTRLKVNGFKNLVDVDVRFGPLTCIAGPNDVGKSNLFDAIAFLAALAERPLLEAAQSVRGEQGRPGNPLFLFQSIGDKYAEEMSFEVEMIVPREGIDDLGQKVRASATLLRYRLTLARGQQDGREALGLAKEELTPIPAEEAEAHLVFPHKAVWRRSAVVGRRAEPLITTEGDGLERVVRLHRESRREADASLHWPIFNLPRTVLSAPILPLAPTVLLARSEMRSWRRMHLEPSALRRPDDLTAPPRLASDGSHLAATLYHLARRSARNGTEGWAEHAPAGEVYAEVANRLFDLVDDVRDVSVDLDEARRLLTLLVTDRNGVSHPAQALSEGTLRFLALAVLAYSSDAGVLCIEEPENGIYPKRIPAMVRLLCDIAMDVRFGVGPDNPLRQVIVNTHSPAVVAEVPEDSLVLAEPVRGQRDGKLYRSIQLSGLDGTWRAGAGRRLGPGILLSYLAPVGLKAEPRAGGNGSGTRRVVDRPDVGALLSPPDGG